MDARRVILRTAALAAAVAVPAIAAYAVTRKWQSSLPGERELTEAGRLGQMRVPIPIPTGRHLVAYVFVSSHCGACRQPTTEKAVKALRAQLLAAHQKDFSNVMVIGVAIDELGDGTKYLQSLNRSGLVFDEFSVGGVWMNQIVSERVWRQGVVSPAVPQVLLVSRKVDARKFPDVVEMQQDSVIMRVLGKSDIVRWVDSRTPIAGSSGAPTIGDSASGARLLGTKVGAGVQR